MAETNAEWGMGVGRLRLEIVLCLVSLAGLSLAWLSLLPDTPQPLLHPRSVETQELAALEDAFAHGHGNLGVARALADRYLQLQQPQLAITTLRVADPQLLQDPGLAHRLARAYEANGRVLDALTTANLAYARCARALGSSEASTVTPVPAYGCSERSLASLRVHREALMHMAQWGVQDPARDVRARTAYQMAQRRAHVATSTGLTIE